ncbi:hypothetical protein AAFF_G00025970 [Aldrovandia affinis]|uniref:Uncharacterized protein n=1 Tax=Aldrovandia affinis TaxID=143900 RepID=A0AAD7S510_9TELE|nr:hypothetical protein AAFF_G00025970 [Aldrovandia affinis]
MPASLFTGHNLPQRVLCTVNGRVLNLDRFKAKSRKSQPDKLQNADDSAIAHSEEGLRVILVALAKSIQAPGSSTNQSLSRCHRPLQYMLTLTPLKMKNTLLTLSASSPAKLTSMQKYITN